jgi:hypothetical protein
MVAMASSSRLGRGLMVTAFVASAGGTVLLLLLLASAGPFDHQNAPPLLWSVVLWGMVGMAAFVILLRLVILGLVVLAGVFYAGRRGAVVAAHALKMIFGGM